MVSHAYFTSNNTWIAPLLTTNIILIGAGGGGGGGAADDVFEAGGGGGGGSIQQVAFVSVTPLTTYTIVIGAGGVGGFPSGSQSTYCGLDGYSTTFSLSGTNLFVALGGGGAGVNQYDAFNHGGVPWSNAGGNYSLESFNASPAIPGSGGGWGATSQANNGMRNFTGGFAGGTANSNNYGAGGGGGGPNGVGGNAGTNLSPNGVNAVANSGAGGGGGNQNCTKGGDGGSGYLHIIW